MPSRGESAFIDCKRSRGTIRLMLGALLMMFPESPRYLLAPNLPREPCHPCGMQSTSQGITAPVRACPRLSRYGGVSPRGSLEDLVRLEAECWGDREAQRLGGLQVDHELESGRSFYG